MSRRKKVRKGEREGGREILIENYCFIAYLETELSETLTEKRDELEESNNEQEKEGKERRERREGENLIGNCIFLQRLSCQRL